MCCRTTKIDNLTLASLQIRASQLAGFGRLFYNEFFIDNDYDEHCEAAFWDFVDRIADLADKLNAIPLGSGKNDVADERGEA